MKDYSPNQQKIIRRYYDNLDGITLQKLSELATEIFLAEGKQQDRLWSRAEKALTRISFPADRIAHLMTKRDPKLLAELVKELGAR